MDEVADVSIEPDGVFKYILIEIVEKGKKSSSIVKKKLIVRGFNWAEYHDDILDRVSPKFHELGLEYKCMGGGRIEHNSSEQRIHIYGYSVGFGQANHKDTKELLSKAYSYPEGNITWSNAGY